ncbi:MAG TPA: response regulator [Chthoniobacteraceae bacterium]|jgi:two-component system CheB/CheR fusion protein|nr:response regulator [Chthoniobacteraceae bacterium]
MNGAPSLRVFIVENHEDTLKWLAIYLESVGHLVQSARSMTSALEALSTAVIDVLISDIGLPDGDGWELLRRAGLPPRVYAIAMSGFGTQSDRLKSRDAGYRQHILKPFVPDDLDAMLEEAQREQAPAGA